MFVRQTAAIFLAVRVFYPGPKAIRKSRHSDNCKPRFLLQNIWDRRYNFLAIFDSYYIPGIWTSHNV